MRRLRGIPPLLLCMLLLFPYAALCENVGNSLVVGMISSSTYSLKPLVPQERALVSLYSLVYESLVYVDDDGKVQPQLAESWQVTNSGKTINFTLRDDVRFSDGTPLRAADVAASGTYLLELANNPDAADNGFYRNMAYSIESVAASGDLNVIVKCKRSYYGCLYNCDFPVVKESQTETENPLGTGPYLITAFTAGDMMLLDPNPQWWQLQPQVQQISVNFYANNKDLMSAYEYGRVDTIFTRSISAAQYKSGNNSISMSYSTRQMEVLMLNCTSHAYPLDNEEIRKAVRYAVNVQLILQNVYMGMGDRTSTMVSPDSWLYSENREALTYDPQQAREILAREGWEDLDGNGVLDLEDGDKVRHLVLGLYVYEDPENNLRVEAANQIADMLADVGISVHVETDSYANIAELLKNRNYDMCLCSIQMDVNPDPGFLLIKGNPMNYMGINNETINSVCKTMRESDGESAFKSNMEAVQDQFVAFVPFIPLFYRTGTVLTRKMYTTVRSIREFELLRGIESFGQ